MLNKLKKSRAGFTLVELIVVIAILAILAGVAIPVYSSYIKKANEAADNQLLAALNTAFGAACIENESDPRNVNARANITETGVTVEPFDEEFQRYYAGNGSFQVFKSLVYVKSEGAFTGAKVAVANNGDGTYTVTLDNGKEVTYTISDEDKSVINASTYSQDMSMGELVGDVGVLVDAAVDILGDTEEEKITKLRLSLGGDEGLAAIGLDPAKDYTSKELGNALVLSVAKNTTASTMEAIQTLVLTGDDSMIVVDGNMRSPKTIANIACLYGMMEGYANSEIGKTSVITYTENGVSKTATVYDYFTQQTKELRNASGGGAAFSHVMQMMQTFGNFDNAASLDAYVGDAGANSQAMTDILGYMTAMQLISENADSLIAGNDVLSIGYDNTNLAAILNGILG